MKNRALIVFLCSCLIGLINSSDVNSSDGFLATVTKGASQGDVVELERVLRGIPALEGYVRQRSDTPLIDRINRSDDEVDSGEEIGMPDVRFASRDYFEDFFMSQLLKDLRSESRLIHGNWLMPRVIKNNYSGFSDSADNHNSVIDDSVISDSVNQKDLVSIKDLDNDLHPSQQDVARMPEFNLD